MTDTQNVQYNAGNFQEYDYELEWMECDCKEVYNLTHLVTAYWYPWLFKPYDPTALFNGA